jgi:hypothetical protein
MTPQMGGTISVATCKVRARARKPDMIGLPARARQNDGREHSDDGRGEADSNKFEGLLGWDERSRYSIGFSGELRMGARGVSSPFAGSRSLRDWPVHRLHQLSTGMQRSPQRIRPDLSRTVARTPAIAGWNPISAAGKIGVWVVALES